MNVYCRKCENMPLYIVQDYTLFLLGRMQQKALCVLFKNLLIQKPRLDIKQTPHFGKGISTIFQWLLNANGKVMVGYAKSPLLTMLVCPTPETLQQHSSAFLSSASSAANITMFHSWLVSALLLP